MAAFAIAFACSAHAQTTPGSGGASTSGATMSQTTTQTSTEQRRMYGGDSFSVIPYATNGYIGINVGKPDWDTPCTGGFACSDSNRSYNLYTGGMFNEFLGAELGYVNFGRADRSGGRTKAHGINLSLVGQVPLGAVNLFAKVGTLYGRSEVSASPLSGAATGNASGWEPSYGVGVGFNFTPRSAVVLEWNRYELNFVGTGKHDITTTSLGYVHRF